MPGLHLYYSNRLDCLARELSMIVREGQRSILSPEPIVVQSKGMERWLTLQLAELDGIAANYRFPFPNGIVEELFNSLLGENPEQTLFTPDVLRLRLVEIIPAHLDSPVFAPLRHYLGKPATDRNLLQLAGEISELFDQYSIYRPDMLLDWEKNTAGGWQGELWRLLTQDGASGHRAARRSQFLKKMAAGVWRKADLPQRLSLFGLSSLPPFHLEIIQTLATCCDVHIFLLNPCREFWGDIAPTKGAALHETLTFDFGPSTESVAAFGNPLLAANGRLGREFFNWLWGHAQGEDREVYVAPPRDTLLHLVQEDILELRWRGGLSPDAQEPVLLSPMDDSIQLHSCHSPQRELEVLHDNLLDLFQRHPDLQPGDILVMAPDIDSYASYIAGVFEACPDPARKIPYSIADRRILSESSVVAYFFAALSLFDSRFAVSDVLALLESAAIRGAWKITEDDLPILQRWLAEVRVRWGVDSEHRRECCGFPFADNSWQQGLDRLMLGYAMDDLDGRLCLDLAPGPPLGNDAAVLLGRFYDFWNALQHWRKVFAGRYELAGWSRHMADFLNELMIEGKSWESEFLHLRQVFADLLNEADAAVCQRQFDLDAIRVLLQERIDRQPNSGHYLSGSVTFAALLPMRSIPFRVVALLGMNDAAFPRQDRRRSFDLLRTAPRPGDRSRRAEDRYLFLEALISARDYLLLSYQGQSCRDNSQLPPSVLISELLDSLDQGFRFPAGAPSQTITRQHPLQPFSPTYFQDGSRLFSFSVENFQASQVQGGLRQQIPDFVSTSLPFPTEELRQVSLADLQRFMKNPADYFLRQRLNLLWREEEDIPADQETFSLQGLERYMTMQSLVEERLKSLPYSETLDRARAAGLLPPGTPGNVSFQDLWAASSGLVESLAPIVTAEPPQRLEGAIELKPFMLNIELTSCFSVGQVFWRGVKIGSRDLFAAWLQHLAFNLVRPSHLPAETFVFGLEESCRFLPVADAEQILLKLLESYWQGLQTPLHYFPQSSFVFASRVIAGKEPAKVLEQARSTWFGSDFSRGECLDAAFQKCFPGDPFDEEFCQVAIDFWQPLLAAREGLP